MLVDARRRWLFLDDEHIREMHNLIRRFHQTTKHPANPVIVPDKPWERAIGHNSGTVFFEKKTDFVFIVIC